jgi:ferric-dicitrate binding protein FerR (iron transport regulator)
LEVKCLTGEVEVKIDELEVQKLSAGRGLAFAPESKIVKELPFDNHNAAAWTKGEFYYSESPLSSVLNEIERQFDVKIEVQGFDPVDRLYSGYFTNEQIRNALDLVCVPMGLIYEMDYKAGVVRVYPMGY